MPQGYWVFPHIDPIIFSIGIFDVRWYGLMYLLGLAFAYWWGGKQAERLPNWNKDQFGDLLFWCFVGVIVGGRIGYVLFYHLDYFLADPLYIFDIQHGGMSFHGGLLGVITAMFLYAWRHNRKFLAVGDFIAPLVPVGLMFGRFGNFINGELWGRPTDVPWAVIFPSGGPIPRHPSQLYEAGLEGIALFFLLYWFTRKPRPTGAVGGLFLIGYGVARFTVEFFREPDAHLGLLSLGMSMGQWLTLPMIILGVALIGWAYYRQPNQQSKEMS